MAKETGAYMIGEDIARQRLVNQQIACSTLATPGDVVQWLGAVQAQDYLGALWALGLRLPNATEQAIEQAIAERTIVRTWPMRGTIHFVAPADVRWMLEVLTPRVVQRSKRRLTELGLDEKIIAASGQRGLHILGQLAQRQLICFGARAGKQPTFTLLDEWAPGAKSLPRDEALATLAQRYFTGHGPATMPDFMWWSGLTTSEAKAGLAAVAGQLGRAVIGEQEYYFAQSLPDAALDPRDAFLLPPFDEFLVAYR